MKFIFFFISSLIYSIHFSESDDNEDKLLAVSVVFRHGDRTPVSFYENDPYKDPSFWPDLPGQLINQGKQRHFELGKFFRKRYNGFLPEKYSETDIKILSTDFDRTLMSAAANLAGLYPPKGAQVWNENLLWQPMPIHTQPTKDDALLSMTKYCAKYYRLIKELLDSEYFQHIDNENQDLYEYLTNNTGSNITSLQDIFTLYDTLKVEDVYFNYALPEWTKQVYPEPLRSLAEFYFAVFTYDSEAARLVTGPFYNQLLENFQEKVDNPNDISHRFRMFSAHDSTIVDLLNSVNAYNFKLPPYSSALLFELRQSNDDNNFYYVNIFYRNGTEISDFTLHHIELDGCDFNCDFSDFVQILEPISLDLNSWDFECQDHKKRSKLRKLY